MPKTRLGMLHGKKQTHLCRQTELLNKWTQSEEALTSTTADVITLSMWVLVAQNTHLGLLLLSISDCCWPAPLSPSATLRISAAVLSLSPSASPHPPVGPNVMQDEWTAVKKTAPKEFEFSRIRFTSCLLGIATSSCFFSWLKVWSSVAACSTWWAALA